MARTSRSYAVIGLGTFGRAIALDLARFGNHVIGIDLSEAAISAVADDLSEAVILDARSEDALRDAGVGECDVAVVANASDLESSVMAAINLRLVGVETVWAKATTRTHHRILSKLGVDRIVNPEEEMAHHLAQVLHNPLVRDYVSLGNGYSVVHFTAPDSLRGRSLDTLKLHERHGIRCIGVMRGTEFVGADHLPCAIEAHDRLLLLGKRADLRAYAGKV